MESIKELVRRLLPDQDLSTLTSEAIVEHIARNRYEGEYAKLASQQVFIQLPVVLQDIILVLDFDIELQMNGIIGFLENSTGAYLQETIAALHRMGATPDFEIMTAIQSLLTANGIAPARLRDNVDTQLSLYQVANSSAIHGHELSAVLDEISAQADKLYLYRHDANLFNHLFSYVDEQKLSLASYISMKRSD